MKENEPHLLVNYDLVDDPIYQEAVDTFPGKEFFTGPGNHHYPEGKALYTTRHSSCLDFWQHFDLVAKKHGGTRLQKMLRNER